MVAKRIPLLGAVYDISMTSLLYIPFTKTIYASENVCNIGHVMRANLRGAWCARRSTQNVLHCSKTTNGIIQFRSSWQCSDSVYRRISCSISPKKTKFIAWRSNQDTIQLIQRWMRNPVTLGISFEMFLFYHRNLSGYFHNLLSLLPSLGELNIVTG